MIDYSQFPGLTGVYLEDSYVLGIAEAPGQLTFKLDAVLTPESPAYHPPQPGEQYCCASGSPDVCRRFSDRMGATHHHSLHRC